MYRIITYSTSFLKSSTNCDLFFGNVKNLTAKKGIHTFKYFFCFPLVKELDQREGIHGSGIRISTDSTAQTREA